MRANLSVLDITSSFHLGVFKSKLHRGLSTGFEPKSLPEATADCPCQHETTLWTSGVAMPGVASLQAVVGRNPTSVKDISSQKKSWSFSPSSYLLNQVLSA